ncbi:MAG: dienelactone hydrolase family protein [Acidimicrobiia bacterium]
MTVLTGEGRVTILYGPQALPMPPYRSVYLARPDLEGRYPAVVVAHGVTGLTPSVKAACRHLARFGYIGVAPNLRSHELSGGVEAEQPLDDLEDVVEALREDWQEWADADRLAFLGLEQGVPPSSRLAAAHHSALIVMGGPEAIDVALLGGSGGPLLCLVATDQADTMKRLHQDVGRGEWVRYGDGGPGFHDEGSTDYHAPSAKDAYERVIAFLDRHLGTPAMA